jgi:hypothetical protein
MQNCNVIHVKLLLSFWFNILGWLNVVDGYINVGFDLF